MRYRHIDTFVQKAGPCSTEGVLVARTGRSPPSSSSSFTTQFFFCNRVRPVTLCVPSCASRKNLPIKQATGFRIKYGKLILSVSGRLNPFWDAIWRGRLTILGRFQLLTCFTRRITLSINSLYMIRGFEGGSRENWHIYLIHSKF